MSAIASIVLQNSIFFLFRGVSAVSLVIAFSWSPVGGARGIGASALPMPDATPKPDKLLQSVVGHGRVA
jgi:hypothetical protein